jgi:hypothetical protein
MFSRKRLDLVSGRKRRWPRILGCLAGILLAVFSFAAAQPEERGLERLVLGKLEIKDGNGITRTALQPNGEIDCARVRAAGTDLLAELKRLEREMRDLKRQLADTSAAPEKNSDLKVYAFQAVFASENFADWKSNPADTRPVYVLGSKAVRSTPGPQEFGKEVIACWWTPTRGGFDMTKWGYVGAGPAGRNVAIGGSASPDAGVIEVMIYVVYKK